MIRVSEAATKQLKIEIAADIGVDAQVQMR